MIASHCVVSLSKTLSAALYWFNLGKQESVPIWLKNCSLVCKKSKQTVKQILNIISEIASHTILCCTGG